MQEEFHRFSGHWWPNSLLAPKGSAASKPVNEEEQREKTLPSKKSEKLGNSATKVEQILFVEVDETEVEVVVIGGGGRESVEEYRYPRNHGKNAKWQVCLVEWVSGDFINEVRERRENCYQNEGAGKAGELFKMVEWLCFWVG